MIQMFFGWASNVDLLRSEVREKVEQVRSELPDDVERILVNNFSTTDFPIHPRPDLLRSRPSRFLRFSGCQNPNPAGAYPGSG